jgi:Zn-finger nucleic acid-binding protein
MNCPKCQQSMETVAYEGIEVARCTGCKGLWFEALKAEHLKQLKGSQSIDTGDAATGKKMDSLSKVLCPVCNTSMIRMVDMDHPDLHFESCKVCYGMFFDAGEFRHYKESRILAFFKKLLGK